MMSSIGTELDYKDFSMYKIYGLKYGKLKWTIMNFKIYLKF